MLSTIPIWGVGDNPRNQTSAQPEQGTSTPRSETAPPACSSSRSPQHTGPAVNNNSMSWVIGSSAIAAGSNTTGHSSLRNSTPSFAHERTEGRSRHHGQSRPSRIALRVLFSWGRRGRAVLRSRLYGSTSSSNSVRPCRSPLGTPPTDWTRFTPAVNNGALALRLSGRPCGCVRSASAPPPPLCGGGRTPAELSDGSASRRGAPGGWRSPLRARSAPSGVPSPRAAS